MSVGKPQGKESWAIYMLGLIASIRSSYYEAEGKKTSQDAASQLSQHGNETIYVIDAAPQPFAVANWKLIQARSGSAGGSVPRNIRLIQVA